MPDRHDPWVDRDAGLQRDLGRIEGKIDQFIKQMGIQDDRLSQQLASQDVKHYSLEKRVRAIEYRQHWYAGAAAALSALATHLGWKFTSGGH